MSTDTATPEGRAKRRFQLERESFEHHASRSKRKGDYHWRMANAISGLGDYVYGQDEGEPPYGAERE